MMKNIQVRPRKGRRPFSYTDKPSPRCRRVVLSDRAYLSVLAEVLSWGGQETGGILFGQVHRGAWYVVEASDPGYPGKTVHTPCYHEMDPEYYNHLYPVLSRLYRHDLFVLGFWHRHPGSLDKFSGVDDRSNAVFARDIGPGCVSILVNMDPTERLTCYFLDRQDGLYHKTPVEIGDSAFAGTTFLALNTPADLHRKQPQLQQELRQFNKGEIKNGQVFSGSPVAAPCAGERDGQNGGAAPLAGQAAAPRT
jgi:hypothetical protein